MSSKTNKTFLRNGDESDVVVHTVMSPAIPHLIPAAAVLAQRPYIQRLMAGTMVFRIRERSQEQEILLLQRAPTDSFPLKWEIPAGTFEDNLDATLVDTAVRELWEEAGLRVLKVLCPVGMQSDATPSDVHSTVVGDTEVDDGDFCLIHFNRSTWGKITFLVDVDNSPVKIDLNEHVAFRWATEKELEQAQSTHATDFELISEGLKRNVSRGFRLVEPRN